MTHRFEPNGKTHRVLEALNGGPATLDELWARLGLTERPGPRRKVFYIVGTLIRDGFVWRDNAALTLRLLPRAEAALVRLRGGELVEVEDRPRPNGRVYRRDAA